MAAKRELEAEREALRQSEVDAAAGVWSKYYTHKAASESLKHSLRSLMENRKVYSMTMEGYRAGRYNIIDLTSIQKDLFSSRLIYIDNRNQWYVTLAELVYETGSFSVEPEINKKIRYSA